MKILFLLPLLALCGCVSQIEKPYLKETVTKADGTITVREFSADRSTGISVGDLKQMPKP